jgi:hypothetical protein
VRAGERALVVVEASLAGEGELLARTMAESGATARSVVWAGDGRPFANAPAHVLDAARDADLYVFLAEAPLPEEAGARFELLQAVVSRGGRAMFLGFVDGALLEGDLSLPQPDLAPVALDLLAQVEGGRQVRVRGRAGTDLTLRVDGRRWLTDALPLQAGGFANFPGGEIHVAPHRDGAEGVLVADLTVPYTIEGLVDAPVTLRFEAGRVTSIEGGRAADALRAIVERAGAGADIVAELGIGFNTAVTPRGHVMLDEKAAGTAHVAIGRNTGPYGGDNEASIHIDCVFSTPTVDVDGRPLGLP